MSDLITNKKVALVLSSGAARGYAHIGAIEELLSRGYTITSVAGTSMGALIGGMFAAGGLESVKEWMFQIKKREVFSLTDVTIALSGFVKGEKVMERMQNIVPDVNIEDLPIPFCAVATNLLNGSEVVFKEGSLYEAIRASISVPSFFRPVERNDAVLVDGGLVNPLPLNRVARSGDDILVAMNVSAYDDEDLMQRKKSIEEYKKQSPLMKKIKPFLSEVDNNVVSLLSRSFSVMIQQNCRLSAQLTPPDVIANMSSNRYGGFDYDKAEKIAQHGRLLMRRSLDQYERGKK